MSVLNYMSVTCAATPISQDSTNSQSVTSPRQTKILLPKKKPVKWSTGVAPGDYGGPPTTTNIPKVWGGGDGDPLKPGDFMWNKDFVGHFQRMIEESDSSDESPPTKEQPSGFLSLGRVMRLDSLEVDLSKELTAPPKCELEPKVETNTQSSATVSRRWKLAPTRREQKKWDKASKGATGGTDEMLREVRRPRGDAQVLAAQSREQYIKLKNKLQILTLGIGGVGLFSAYVSYSPEIAASFGAGCLGSLVYIRMLGTSMDSFATGGKGVVKGAIAQPRLLVPVALVMIYSRWNEILVPEYGFMHLELIPMLVGFFTYKIATFLQAIEDAFSVVAKKTQG